MDNVERENILTGDFLLYDDSDIKIYYAPHNEYINRNAKVLVVGITPGWTQTQKAFQTAKKELDMGKSDESICRQCKMESRFAGTMRKNLVVMLDELGLQQRLGLASCMDLFDVNNNSMHTTSMIMYPCFYKEKNYSGHSPAIMATHILRNYIENSFMEELRCIDNVRLIIPLGAAVESVFQKIDIKKELPHCTILWGFPHPSGLNSHRHDQLNHNRDRLLQTIEKCKLW